MLLPVPFYLALSNMEKELDGKSTFVRYPFKFCSLESSTDIQDSQYLKLWIQPLM